MQQNRPTILDVEASGFGANSYPIEIGIVRGDGERYCKLIKPFDDWLFWQHSAENVHGICRQDLVKYGVHGTQICIEINAFLGSTTAYSDGWVVDSPWLRTLYERSQVNMKFKLSSLEMILNESQMQCWHTVKDNVIASLNLVRHRASNDALIIQKTFELTHSQSILVK
jgi:hypothetical protein